MKRVMRRLAGPSKRRYKTPEESAAHDLKLAAQKIAGRLKAKEKAAAERAARLVAARLAADVTADAEGATP